MPSRADRGRRDPAIADFDNEQLRQNLTALAFEMLDVAGKPPPGGAERATFPRMTATDALTIDVLDPHWWVDLDRVHEVFARARREAPVFRDVNGYWVVTRHADVVDVERRHDVFSSRGCYRANVALEESNMIALDDPEHLAQRRLVSGRFTPRAVQRQTEFLTARIRELVDAVADRGRLEVVHDLAAQLPAASPPTCSASRRTGGRTSSRGPSG